MWYIVHMKEKVILLNASGEVVLRGGAKAIGFLIRQADRIGGKVVSLDGKSVLG